MPTMVIIQEPFGRQMAKERIRPLRPSAHWMREVHKRASKTLEDTRATMSKYYDKGKQEHPAYEIGNLVMLNAKYIRTKRPTKKLAPKLYGPFRILEKIGSRSFRLELQTRWRIHNVFHVSLLEP